MAFKVVQKVATIDIASSGGTAISAPIAMKTGYLRITPTQNSYIEVGPNPVVNTSTSLYVPANTPVVIKEEWGSKGFVGIITGTTTTIVFPQGTGGGFNVGDAVAISGCSPAGLNTSFATVLTVDDDMSYDSYHNTRLTLDWNTSAVGAITDQEGELRKVTKVSAYNAGGSASRIHITEVQSNAYT